MHQTIAVRAIERSPASISCKCGWTYSGGGYYRCLQAAQKHRLDALERRECVVYGAAMTVTL